MEWCVVKTGAELFDLLHVYGLGILLAQSCREPIEVVDTGWKYTLTGHAHTQPSGSLALLDEILILPTPQEVEAARLPEVDLPIANLDGLLTVLFTTPGVRSLSVADVLRKNDAERAIKKVHHTLVRWKDMLSKMGGPRGERWLEDVLHDYDAVTPALPIPADASSGRDLTLVMMLDPSFSYSTHRPRSDGLVSHKTQIAIRGTPFAVLLAAIGAARFLRAQRLGGNLVNCYVPKAERMILDRNTRVPLLTASDMESAQAVLVQWCSYASNTHAHWTGVAYQTIQTQGGQQSIPRDRGCLDLIWFTSRTFPSQKALFTFWRALLTLSVEQRPCEIDALVDALRTRSHSQWVVHLLEMARSIHATPKTLRPYTLEEVKEVTDSMTTSIPSLLKKALEQKTGTLRFGQAMRLLGEVNGSALRDLVEELEAVTTLDHLFHVLALIAQYCQVATAKTIFMVVPSEDDLGALLMDVEQSNPRTIAQFLVILSAIRYPPLEKAQQDMAQLTRLLFLLTTALGTLLPKNEEEQ